MEQNNKGYVLINLMPYREKIKSTKIRKLNILLTGFAGLAAVFVFGLYSLVSLETDFQLQRNEFIVNENKKLDSDIKEILTLKDDIKQTLEKRKVVEDLQVDRSDGVNILNLISSQLPEGASLRSIKQVESKINIIGLTQSNNKVSNYMTNLESTSFFTNANLIEIKAIQNPNQNGKKLAAKVADDLTISEFNMEVTVKPKAQVVEDSDKKNVNEVTK